MLLPLRGIEGARRLRKNVRFKALRFALVGEDLREAPHALAGPRLARRPQVPASGPSRTRPAPEAVLGPRFKFSANSVWL